MISSKGMSVTRWCLTFVISCLNYYRPTILTVSSFFFLILINYLFIFGCIGSFLLHAGFLFSSCGERGPPFSVVRRPLTAVASLVVDHGV